MPNERLWIFAYASLMWYPGFTPERTETAWISGYHRALCILSIRYRGTEKSPGLVMGLDRGGSCRGQVHLVKRGEEERVKDDLFEREMKTGVYHPLFLNTRLEGGTHVKSLAFVARRDHEQYRRLDEAEAASYVKHGVGDKGRAFDYLANTLARMDELGIHDAKLKRILDLAT
jgi:cation transport protein ChaC